MDEVTGEWRKVHNTELHALYSSSDIIRNIKSRLLRWAEHVARMGESRNAYRVLVGRPERKRPLGRPRHTWEGNIKMDLREVGYDDREWINLARKLVEEFHRNEEKIADKDIARRTFAVADGHILLKFHYTLGKITAATREFIKSQLTEMAEGLTFNPELTAGYQTDPTDVPQKQLYLFNLLEEQLQAEENSLLSIRQMEDEVRLRNFIKFEEENNSTAGSISGSAHYASADYHCLASCICPPVHSWSCYSGFTPIEGVSGFAIILGGVVMV
ncbi:hypothetical protein ANN_17723 [Periplaneta americana]|uniref:Dynein regulatory complex subunit 7 MORN domain-containing protein n=1 Tax=Periplaneta americana TaxID=6978 RepID=A0ABQ8STQ7_PERAM|nr:hypothetical protein ANN_17723 [Periplaneta americana]